MAARGTDLLAIERGGTAYKATAAEIAALASPKSPAFNYNPNSTLNTITYADGTLKTFAYSGGKPAYLDTLRGGVTTRKTFNYNPDGTVASVIEVVI